MKPIKDRILVTVDMSQKSSYEIKTPGGLVLWMRSDFGFDQKSTAPVIATVLHPGVNKDLSKGDKVLCHHNTFNRNINDKMDVVDDTGVTEDGHAVFSVNPDKILFKIIDGVLHPRDGWLMVENVEIKRETVLFTPDSVVNVTQNQYKVISVGGSCPGVKPGDIVITYDRSGVPVRFTNDMVKSEILRCKYDNVLAINKMI